MVPSLMNYNFDLLCNLIKKQACMSLRTICVKLSNQTSPSHMLCSTFCSHFVNALCIAVHCGRDLLPRQPSHRVGKVFFARQTDPYRSALRKKISRVHLEANRDVGSISSIHPSPSAARQVILPAGGGECAIKIFPRKQKLSGATNGHGHISTAAVVVRAGVWCDCRRKKTAESVPSAHLSVSLV